MKLPQNDSLIKVYETAKKQLTDMQEIKGYLKSGKKLTLANISVLCNINFNCGSYGRLFEHIYHNEHLQKEVAESKFPIDKKASIKGKIIRKKKIKEEMQLIKNDAENMTRAFYGLYEEIGTILECKEAMEKE